MFNDFNSQAFGWGLNTALDLYKDQKTWRKLIRNGMAMDYSWERQGADYVDIFRRLIASRKNQAE